MSNLEITLGIDRAEIRKIAKIAGRYYSPMDVMKYGTNKWRHIDNPDYKLKYIQKRIAKRLLSNILLPDTMTGGVSKRSISDNAKPHINQPIVICLDLRDCFPSINNEVVYSIYKNGLKCSSEISVLLAQLTTFQTRVPQGAPSSSIIVNLALLPLHNRIAEYCIDNKLKWSFFVDDITISGLETVKHINNLIKIIQKSGYKVRNRKILVMRSNNTQSVTGMVVNKKVSIPKKYIEKLRTDIIKLSHSENPITQSQLDSIYGQVQFVLNNCEVRGVSVRRLADNLLPTKGISTKTKETLDKYRKCKSTKNCVKNNH